MKKRKSSIKEHIELSNKLFIIVASIVFLLVLAQWVFDKLHINIKVLW